MLFLQIAHIAVTAFMILTILLQQKGSGLGDAFGGDTSVYTSRRGVEKVLYYMTIIFGSSFVVLAILQLAINK